MVKLRKFLRMLECPVEYPGYPKLIDELCIGCKHLAMIVDEGVLCRYEDDDDDDSGGME